jgi:hypothetical protein
MNSCTWKGPTWEVLPSEVLQKVFNYVPRHLLEDISQVCTRWRDFLHDRAVDYLTNCVNNQLIDEKQLEQRGWSSAAAWNHNKSACSCILLAFNFFTREKELPLVVRKFPEIVQGNIPRIMGEKVFFRFSPMDPEWFLRIQSKALTFFIYIFWGARVCWPSR